MDIRESRTSAGLSRPKMSKIFDIPVRTIENWESGVNDPPPWAEKLIIEKLNRITEENKMKNYEGMKWGELTEEERYELLRVADCIDGTTSCSSKGGDCIVDFAGTPLSVPGYKKVGEDEDEIIIKDDAIIYDSWI